MALNGTHIAFGYVGGIGEVQEMAFLLRNVVWSETLSAPGTTANSARNDVLPGSGTPVFEVSPAADSYVAVGPAPDASQAVGSGNAARLLVRAGETRNVFCRAGDKVAWAAA